MGNNRLELQGHCHMTPTVTFLTDPRDIIVFWSHTLGSVILVDQGGGSTKD